MVTQWFLGRTSLQPVHSLYLSPFSLYLFISLSVSLGERQHQEGLNVMAQDQRERKEGVRNWDGGRERSCLPCSLGDSALASLHLTCTGLPKAAASQAIVPKLGSHWMGGAPPAPLAAQQRFIGSVRANSWSSTSDWLRSTALLHRGFAVAEILFHGYMSTTYVYMGWRDNIMVTVEKWTGEFL